jgi:hypothetical protein
MTDADKGEPALGEGRAVGGRIHELGDELDGHPTTGDGDETGTEIAEDGGATFDYQFSPSDVSAIDYFHPSQTDQAVLAGLTWAKSWWPLALPTAKDQCKNGGWRDFSQFKNQGDCIQFVNTGK